MVGSTTVFRDRIAQDGHPLARKNSKNIPIIEILKSLCWKKVMKLNGISTRALTQRISGIVIAVLGPKWSTRAPVIKVATGAPINEANAVYSEYKL